MRTTVSKSNKNKKIGRKEGSKTIAIDSKKLSKFCQLFSMSTPRATVQTELKIKKAQYYRYIDAAEEIVDDFLLGMVDHGLVLQFRNSLIRVQKRAEKLDDLANSGLDNYDKLEAEEKHLVNRLVSNANATDKLYSEMLDDTKIVNQTVKTLNKVIVKSREKKV